MHCTPKYHHSITRSNSLQMTTFTVNIKDKSNTNGYTFKIHGVTAATTVAQLKAMFNDVVVKNNKFSDLLMGKQDNETMADCGIVADTEISITSWFKIGA